MRGQMQSKDFTNPFKGPHAFQFHDQSFFFCRDREIDRLAEQISLQPLSVLHAPSGAGKSSLIRAGLIPKLENDNHRVVICQPGMDPSRDLAEATLARLLPEPQAEAQRLHELSQVFSEETDLNFDKAHSLYRKLDKGDPNHRKLMGDVELTDNEGVTRKITTATALALFLDDGVDELDRYFKLLFAHCNFALEKAASGSVGALSINALIEALKKDDVIDAHRLLVSDLADRHDDLKFFFEILYSDVLPKGERHDLVLIVDQFEQLYTQFGDQERAKRLNLGTTLNDYRVRDRFLENFAELILANRVVPKLSMRILISLRDDFFAELWEFERRVGAFRSGQRFRLDRLSDDRVETAMNRPAGLVGFSFSDGLVETVRRDLCFEARFVEPAQVQIVCDRIWQRLGREKLVRSASDTSIRPMIDVQDLARLGDVAGIFRNYLRGVVEQQLGEQGEQTDRPLPDQIEILDMLQQLTTAQGTRLIVTYETLLKRPLRDQKKREALFEQLDQATILRRENLRGTSLVDIVHEVLLTPLFELAGEKRNDVAEWSFLEQALNRLESGALETRTRSTPVLQNSERDAVFWFRDNLDPIAVSAWIAEAMSVEILLTNWRDLDGGAEFSDQLQYWCERAHVTRLPLDLISYLIEGKYRLLYSDEITQVLDNEELNVESEYLMRSAIINASVEGCKDILTRISSDGR